MLKAVLAGDSLMWGQGLLRSETYASLALKAIAASQGDEVEVLDLSHSGAKLAGITHPTKIPIEVQLPSGELKAFPASDWIEFYYRYPLLFTSDAEVLAFLSGGLGAEAPALKLHGEIPRPFPTIAAQVGPLCPKNAAQEADILLIDGAANDIDFEAVMNPESDLGGEQLNSVVKRHAYDALGQILRNAGKAFPQASIIYVGTYSALTPRTSRSELEALFKFVSEKAHWKLALNDFATSDFGKITPPGMLINLLFDTKDFDALMSAAIQRCITTAALMHFWSRRAVMELRREDGNRYLYVHPAFPFDNQLFGSSEPFIHEDYRDPVHDHAAPARLDSIPRHDLLDLYREQSGGVSTILDSDDFAKLIDAGDMTARVLKKKDPKPPKLFTELVKASGGFQAEVARIEVHRVASFVHPTPVAARHIANRIVERYGATGSLRHLTESFDNSSKALSLKDFLNRYLMPNGSLRQLADVAQIENLSLEIVFGEPVTQLGYRYTLLVNEAAIATADYDRQRAGAILLSFDITDPLELTTIRQLQVVAAPKFKLSDLFDDKPSVLGRFPINELATIHLWLNGIKVRQFSSSTFDVSALKLSLPYPPRG